MEKRCKKCGDLLVGSEIPIGYCDNCHPEIAYKEYMSQFPRVKHCKNCGGQLLDEDPTQVFCNTCLYVE